MLKKFKGILQEQAEEMQETTSNTVENFRSQVGKTSESFSQQLSSAEKMTKRSLRKIIAVSLIPTVLLIIWELIRHNWLLT